MDSEVRSTTTQRPIATCCEVDKRCLCALSGAAGTRLAGAQEALAYVALVLGTRVEGGGIGERVEPREAEQLIEQLGAPVHHSAEAGPPGFLDQAALEQGPDGRFG